MMSQWLSLSREMIREDTGVTTVCLGMVSQKMAVAVLGVDEIN